MPKSGLHRDAYLFVDDLPALRKKLKTSRGVLRDIYQGLQAQIPDGVTDKPLPPFYFPAFSYLVTGKEEHAALAAEAIRATLRTYLAGDYSHDVHFHTWCNAAPMARLAAAYDWIADSPSLSRSDVRDFQEAILDYTFKHPYNRLKGRMRAFDNQIAAMSFCCTLVGYLFGSKRDDDARAHRMLAEGLLRLPDLIGLCPPGGYSGEGSTYFGLIVAPVTAWYCALVEQITGQDVFFRRFPPHDTSAQDILGLYFRLVGPSGLMPPWDHYGWMRCPAKMPLAYLARKTGDLAPWQLIEELGLHAEASEIAWGGDDDVWTLLWSPDSPGAGEASGRGRLFSSWAVPSVAAALVCPEKQMRLFQAWDRSSFGVYVGRCQVNPNMITFEAWGSPVLTDGIPDTQKCSFFDFGLEDFKDILKPGEADSIRDYYLTFNPKWDTRTWIRGFSYGLLGGSNSVLINGERQYTPGQPQEGKLVAFCNLPGLQMAASEAALFYQPRYPIESMVRTTLLVRDEYLLTADTIECSQGPLDFDWQVFARGQVTLKDRAVCIRTPEAVEVHLLPLDPDLKPTLTEVDGFPRDFEGRSTCIRYRLSGQRVVLPFLILPRHGLKPLVSLQGNWHAAFQGRQAGLDCGLHLGFRSGQAMPIQACGPAALRTGKPGWLWASRTFRLPRGPIPSKLYLRFPSAADDLEVWVNGEPAPSAPSGLAPRLVEFTGLVRAINVLVVGGTAARGKFINGSVQCLGPAPEPDLPEATRLGEGHYRISGHSGTDEIWISARDGRIDSRTVRGEARALLHSEGGGFAACQATRLEIEPGISFSSDRPIDVAWRGREVTLGDFSGPDEVRLAHPDFHLLASSRGALDIHLVGRKRPTLRFRLQESKPLLVNDRVYSPPSLGSDGELAIPPRAFAVLPRTPRQFSTPAWRMSRLARLAVKGGDRARGSLLRALGDPDWRVQQFAAELAGRIGCRKAVRPLLDLLARESPDQIYDLSVFLWWREACEKLEKEGPAYFLQGPNGKPMVKQYRLKLAIIEALGRLRAREAVPALCEILRDSREFYPVHSAACRALGLIGDPAAGPALEAAAGYAEVNTRGRARDALHRLRTGHPLHPAYPDRGYDA
ncbi:MAG: HEAT repeat domain-containing protein [Planctomycetes bacterium]|nr:HEAT repeat domain-containing protein [Planctomycetota bacterium]